VIDPLPQPLLQAQVFYDGPEPPAGLFDEFLNISSVANTVGTQSFTAMINAITISRDLAGVRYVLVFLGIPYASL
jgi:hypothetical protein